MQNYNRKLQEFIELLTADQRAGVAARGGYKIADKTYAFLESGRKYDKILVSNGSQNMIRYFVCRKSGTIYGARSRLAPNLKWYFGTLDSVKLWDWSDYHGIPVKDDSVRVAGQYGGYTHYMPI
jgi:hypothetical protein